MQQHPVGIQSLAPPIPPPPFLGAEFMPRRTARELVLLRTLTPHAAAHARQLLSAYPLLRITSARRSPTHNKRVGGSPTSFHLRGRACDFVGPEWDLIRAAGAAWAFRIGPGCTGPEEVLLERLGQPGEHLHVAW